MSSWEERMAARAHERRQAAEPPPDHLQAPDRQTWPVPDHLKGYSARDVFLWYIADGWRRILGGDVRVVFDHDFGYHILTDGQWQLELANLEQFPHAKAEQEISELREGIIDDLPPDSWRVE